MSEEEGLKGEPIYNDYVWNLLGARFFCGYCVKGYDFTLWFFLVGAFRMVLLLTSNFGHRV